MRKEYGQAMDWSGAPEMGGAIGPTGTQREISTAGLPELNPASRYYKEAGDALYNQWAERAMPQQQAQTDALRTQLYNQGLREGDAGFDNELAKLRMSQGDQQRQAAFSATAGAGQEASRYLGMDAQTRQQLFGERGTQADLWNSGGAQMFGQQQASSAYQNQLRQQFMAEQMQRRGFTLNEINALLTGQQVGMPSMPGFSQAQRAEGADYMRAGENQWGASMDAANLQQAQNQMMMSGITDLAGAGFKAFSDRRLKRDIKRIGTLFGVPIYTWHWIWGGDGVGVMADEVPWAIAGKINDYFVVDYGRIW
jgi:hypothetical protein